MAEWAGVACIGAAHTQFSSKRGETNEWHYYIANLKLSAEEPLRRTRLEWSEETTRWLLDVHFKEKNEVKWPLSRIMFDCLLDCDNLLPILCLDEN
jgi:hypothetical protein